MKQKTIVISTILTLLLTACGAAPNVGASGTQPTVAATDTPQVSVSSAATQVPATNSPSVMQLAVGIFKLDGTSQAISAGEATTLIPLWQSLDTIETNAFPQRGQTGNGTPQATPQDMSAVQTQIQAQVQLIQAALTTGQVQAIQGMQISFQDVRTVMQQEGIVMGNSGPGNGTFTPRGTPRARGTPGAGFGNNGTPRPGFGQRSADFAPPGLITALIQYLQKKAGS